MNKHYLFCLLKGLKVSLWNQLFLESLIFTLGVAVELLMMVLAAVSLRLIITVCRLLPLWKSSWCPLQPHCPLPSPARTWVGRHQAAPCPDPSPLQPVTEVGTAQHGQQRHVLELNAGLLQHSWIAAAPHGFSTSLQLNPVPILKSAPSVTQVRASPFPRPGWAATAVAGTPAPCSKGCHMPCAGALPRLGAAVRQQQLCRPFKTCGTALIQHNTQTGVPGWNGKYQLCSRSLTLEF